jgi:hypothetical protein
VGAVPRRRLTPVFVAIAVAFVVGAIWHATQPGARHHVFVAINALAAIGLVLRPRGFVIPFAVLTAQQLISHGGDLARRFDGASLGVVILLPATLALLAFEELQLLRRR